MKKLFSIIALLCIVVCFFVGCDTNKEIIDYVNDDIYLSLVNKQNKVPRNWDKVMEIETARNCLGEVLTIEHRTYEQFQLLREDLLANEDIQIELDSVYRTIEEQQKLWDEWSKDPELGPGYCLKYLSPPRYSEHHTGLAVDIFIMKNGKPIRDNEEMLTDIEDFAVIHRYLPKYGFILRYLKGKESITGYDYEPWHIRFINNKDIAAEITKNGITLEEYLANNY